ncbi:MAG TPA: CoA ester lyase [Rhizomicrobium sp.]
MLMRSKLFVPGSRPELFAKAETSEADSLSFDLEDSVTAERKDEARENVARHLRNRADTGKVVLVRINGIDSPHFVRDVREAAHAHIVNLPMVEDPAQVIALADLLARCEPSPGHARILVNIETPRALRRAGELAAAHERVMGLQIGYADLLESSGIDRRDHDTLSYIRLSVRLAAAENGLNAYDGAFAAVSDADGYRAECLAARRQGFVGKTCIHPSQIAIANACFRPSEAEVARAHRIVAAAEDAKAKGIGAILVDGHMVDRPFVEGARAILAADAASR